MGRIASNELPCIFLIPEKIQGSFEFWRHWPLVTAQHAVKTLKLVVEAEEHSGFLDTLAF